MELTENEKRINEDDRRAETLGKRIGERIKIARERAGIKTKSELAKMLFVHERTVGEWEAGKVQIKYVELKRIAKLLGVSIFWLGEGEGQMDEIVTMRDCAKMLFRDLPNHFKCSWSVRDPAIRRGMFPIETLPTLTYRLAIPAETIHDLDTGYPTEYAYCKDDYQAFLSCAEDALLLECIRKCKEKYFHESDYAKLFEQVPNKPLNQ